MASLAKLAFGAWLLILTSRLGAEVQISELMYHPDNGVLEFIELHNTGDTAVSLAGWRFDDGVIFEFPEASEIGPGGWVVVCRDREQLAIALGIPLELLQGNYQGALSNSGERVALRDAQGRTVDAIEYSDAPPFDPLADGPGRSLERRCFEVRASAPGNWGASEVDGGTPLASNSTLACPPPLPAPLSPVVINEIHYHPVEGADPSEEFLELHNRTDSPVDVDGWRLAGGVEYLFDRDAGPTLIPAGGFLLVAKEPATISRVSGIAEAAIAGPYVGKLSNFHDEIELQLPGNVTVDRVEYSQDGLWPARADGLGSSLQLIDPEVSSSLPQNWKVAATERCSPEEGNCVLLEGGSRVRWFENLDGMDPGFAGSLPWYDPEFDDVSNGWRDGGLAVGYDLEVPDGQPWVVTPSTPRAGLHSILLRIEFFFDPQGDPCEAAAPLLSADWDDGYVAWLNGVEVARGGMLDPPGTAPVFDGEYRAEVVTAGGFRRPEPSYQLIWTGVAGSIQPGRNVLAIGNYNSAETSSDLYLAARLMLGPRFLSRDTTPGQPSAVGYPAVPPLISAVEHLPAEPRSTDGVSVEALVEGPDIDRVQLIYDAGSGETTLPMRDDGLEGDRVGGDGLYAARIPPLPHLTLVKYRVEAWPSGGAACPASFPREGNPGPYTGYLVADDRPAVNEDVRLFYIFTPGALLDLSCDDGVYRTGTFVDFRGRAHFDVGVKHRGATACGYPKKPLRVKFNKGDTFDGQQHLNFNAGWNDKAMLREKLGFDFFRDVRVPYCETHMARVHTNGGSFHGVYFTIEDPSSEYLRRNGWDDDAPLYKCYTAMLSGSTSGYEACTDAGVERLPEVGAFGAELNATSGPSLIAFLNSRLDVEEVIDYQVVQAVIMDLDSVTKNWLLYNGPHGIGQTAPDRFGMFAWDLDLTHGQMRLTTDVRSHTEHPLLHTQTYPFTDQGHHGIINALLQRAPDDYYVKAHYGRMWAFLQEKFRPSIFFPKLDRYDAATIAHVRQDLARWPRTWGARGSDPDYWRDDLRAWAQRRYDYLVNYLRTENPTTLGRRFQYVPAPRLKLTEIQYNPDDGEDFEFLEIRNLESTPVDLSGWSIPAIQYVFPQGSTVARAGLIVVAKSPALLASRSPIPVGVPVFGPYTGNLDNGGEDLRLQDSGLFRGKAYYPETIDLVMYDDVPPWPLEADGEGYSLELGNLSHDNDLGESWQRSEAAGGTPGVLTAVDSPPVVILLVSPTSGVAPLAVNCDAARSYDPDGSWPLTMAWDFGDGTAGAGEWATHTYAEPGVFRGSVTVHDGTSFTVQDFEVQVSSPIPPVVVLSVEPLSGVAPLDVSFDASASFDPGGKAITTAWDLGDGSVGSGETLTHTYRDPGVYQGRVTVDSGTLSSTQTFTIEVFPRVPRFHRGDANADGRLDISDAIFVLRYLFLGGEAPGCLESANADDSAMIDLTDGIYILNFIFLGGPAMLPPGAPGLPCGPDPPASQGDLGCEAYVRCGG